MNNNQYRKQEFDKRRKYKGVISFCNAYDCPIFENLLLENKQLKEDIKELELLVGIRQKRNLISKFDKEFDEEDKKKNPNRGYVGIMPDAEEVYKRYYELKNQLKQREEVIDEAIQLLEYYYIGNLKYSKDSQIAFRRLLSILWRYKGDSK